jgi:hypothetical protein
VARHSESRCFSHIDEVCYSELCIQTQLSCTTKPKVGMAKPTVSCFTAMAMLVIRTVVVQLSLLTGIARGASFLL